MPKLRDREVDEYLYDCVQVDPLRISEEYTRIGADLAYWNAKYADAQRAVMARKAYVERKRASVYITTRERMEDNGDKFSEGLLANRVEIDPSVMAARDAFNDAEAHRLELNGVLDAVRTKRDMLVSLGAHLRAELQGDPALRAYHRNNRDADRERGQPTSGDD